MSRALVGYTGFVGGSLLRQCQFDALYNSLNIEAIAGKSYDLVVCAGAPGQKWRANQDPASDRASVARLQNALAKCRIGTLIVISTVDVYPTPIDVDETSPVDRSRLAPYGLHRLQLEEFARTHCQHTHIVRLPGLFGQGLKKNFIFDLLHENCLTMTDNRSRYQFYDVDRLWNDCINVLREGLPLVNFATPPVSCDEVANRCFGRTFSHRTEHGPVRYDIHTRHASLMGGAGPYIQSVEEILIGIERFVAIEQKRRLCA